MSVHEDDESESPEALGQDDDGKEATSPTSPTTATASTTATGKRPKRSRACQACRAMKIRCLPVDGQEACRACSRVNRECIMPGPARKRQKTVHKVAELEKKIDALTASLAAKNAALTAPTPPNDSPAATTSTPGSKGLSNARRDKEHGWDYVIETNYPSMDHAEKDANGIKGDEAVAVPPNFIPSEDGDEYEDVIARGLLDEATATKIYHDWKTGMNIYQPMVAFPDYVNVEWMRKKKPMALLAIFVVGSGFTVPDIQPDLAVELARQLADRVMFYNEKSIDLIQAMLIYTNWYGKHKFARDLGFNHYIHSAVAMCLDLGLGKRSRQQTFSDFEDAEMRRTWMACYEMASNVATVLRLPPLVKYSPYIEECLEKLSTDHPGALPSDKLLCCYVRLSHMIQDVGLLFHMDDPGSSIPLNDSRTQYHLKLFERQLSEWVEATRPYLPKLILEQYEAISSLYIHEIALHNEHNVDDFRPMYRSTGRETPSVTKDFLTNAHFEALTICVDSMQRAMHAFLDMDVTVLRALPALHIVWTAYVAVAMIRLHGVLAVPDSKYGSVFLPQLKVSAYLDKCVAKLQEVTFYPMHPAENFAIAFRKLKAWHVHRTVSQMQAFAKEQGAAITQAQSKTDTSGQQTSRPIESYPGAFESKAVFPCNDFGSDVPTHQDSSLPPQHQRGLIQPQLPQFQNISVQQPYQMPTPGTVSPLLDPNIAIDASTFDIQNWDVTLGELDNFENSLNDAGWMAYLM